MPDPTSPPLHLYQVLEEEYLSLHGELEPETMEVTLGERVVTAKLDWGFHRGHVRGPDRLLRKMLGKGGGAGAELSAHFRGLLDAEDLVSRYEASRDPADPARRGGDASIIEGALNELLRQHVYNAEAFKYVVLNDSTRSLLDLCARRDGVSSETLAHANRLLLEETFPKELEKVSDVRLAAIYTRLHARRHAALSLSGGGIRSGTFALGLLQGLAHYKLLQKFDYLSTVSGGGYIGGWLSAWLHRHGGGLAGVTDDLDPTDPHTKIDPDAPALQHLREYSNFVTPKKGLLTADTWAFVAIYLRNLFLNWLVLIPLLAAVLALPRLNVSFLLSQGEIVSLWSWLSTRLGIALITPRYALLAFGSLMLVLALTYIGMSSPSVSEKVVERSPFWRERRTQGWFLALCLLPLVAAAFCLTTYWAWSSEAHAGETEDRLPYFILFGVAIPFVAWLLTCLFLERYKPKYWKEFGVGEFGFLAFMLITGGIGGGLFRLASKLVPNPVTPVPSGWWVTGWYACLAVPALLVLLFLATNFLVGFASRGLRRIPELMNDEDREWWARFGAWVLIAALAWAVFCVLSIHGPRALFYAPKLLAALGGASGAASLLAGFSSRTPANDEQESKGGMLASIISGLVLPLAALAFLLFFLSLLSLLTSLVLWGVPSALTTAPSAGLNALGHAALRGHLGDIVAPFDAVAHMLVVHHSALWFVGLFVVVAGGAGLFMAWRINLNRFSLHAGYRNRLIRAFLGASRARGERKPNPFTGFDPADNVQMHELRPVLFHEGDFKDIEALAARLEAAKDDLSAFIKANLRADTLDELQGYDGNSPLERRLLADLLADLNTILESEEFVPDGATLKKVPAPGPPQGDRLVLQKRKLLERHYGAEVIRPKYPPPHRLLHIVNTTLNLVGGKKLAWQQRKAEPFAVSPLHAGCFRVGYRRARYYGGEKGISLGTAQAISGAAASSNMGYYTTSPVLSLVLTLFNVRLGWWLGNPGPAGQTTYHRASPRLSITPVVQEALGLTDDTSAYVYLTDGGHFENLALYEMVLRRCHLIVLSDGTGDPKFEFGDLGNAVRKIRIDLGVPIEFDEVPIYAKAPAEGRCGYWAYGRIRYTAVDEGAAVRDGLLIYFKPSVYGVEPRDVVQYKVANPDFPHQSTGDQFFDESQFESYRTLGWYAMTRLCANRLGPDGAESFDLDLPGFVRAALDNYRKPCRPDYDGGPPPPFNAPGWVNDFLDGPWPGR